MEKVQKLEIDGGRKAMIEKIECKELREFVCTYKNYTRIPFLLDKWDDFVGKHQQLESFSLLDFGCPSSELKVLVLKLPKLKSLKISKIICTDQVPPRATADLIGENYERLEHLDVKFEFFSVTRADIFEFYIKNSYPHVNYERVSSKIIGVSK